MVFVLVVMLVIVVVRVVVVVLVLVGHRSGSIGRAAILRRPWPYVAGIVTTAPPMSNPSATIDPTSPTSIGAA